MRALITGGNGYIGTHLVDALLRSGAEVVVLDRKLNQFCELPDQVIYINGEVNNRGSLSQALRDVDVVFHLAWAGIHQSSNQDPRGDIELNLLPTLTLLELSVQTGVRKVVFLSSGGTVYGRNETLPIKETSATNPLNGYGITKLAAEKYVQLYGYLYNLDYVILRPSVPYGERQDPHGAQGAVAVFMGRVLRGEPIEIWGDGTIVRDFFYVGDLAEACRLAAFSPVQRGIYNIGGGKGITLNEVAETIQRISGVSVPVKYTPGRAFDAPNIVLDISSAQTDLGWRPRVDLEDGLSRTWRWIRSVPGTAV